MTRSSDQSSEDVHPVPAQPDLNQQTLQAILDRLNSLDDWKNSLDDWKEGIEERQQKAEESQGASTAKRKASKAGGVDVTTFAPAEKKKKKNSKKQARKQAQGESDSDSSEEDGEVEESDEDSSEDELDQADINIPLDDMVDDALSPTYSKKILKGKFVEFSDLLPDLEYPVEQKFTMSIDQSSGGAVFKRKKDKKNLPFQNYRK